MQDAPKTRLLPRDPLIWGDRADGLAVHGARGRGDGLGRPIPVAGTWRGGGGGMGFALFSGTMAIMRFAGDAVRNRFGAVLTLRASAISGYWR